MTRQILLAALLSLTALACENKTTSPPAAPANSQEPPSLEVSGILGLEKVDGAPGKNSEVYLIGGSEYFSLSLEREDPRVVEALHKGKLLLEPAADSGPELEHRLRSLVGKGVVVTGRVRPRDRSDWANPNNMQALVETAPDGSRRTLRPGSIGAFIVTELRAR